jgi:muramoyltetrapeptide carboxypeptidase LdcA involved in peptidoglycan recycling
LEQLFQSDFSKSIKWIVIGKFQNKNLVAIEQLKTIIAAQRKTHWIPIVANINFGHTTPIVTFPLWWIWSLSAYTTTVKISILKH